MSEASGGTENGGGISNQLAALVPSFDPSRDDLQIYQQKVQLVLSVWPKNRIAELVTRLILNTTGSAFAKLQIHHSELSTNEEKSVQKLIEHLGGQWGRTGLEKRYSDAEKALFQCNQQTDESHDSYLARADVLWSKLKSQKLQIEDLQAYITLRGAQLSGEDKKRIILDSDSSLEGKLTIVRVQEAVRMLGTSFVNEMTGLGKKSNRSKVYDSSTLVVEDGSGSGDFDDPARMAQHDEWNEDEILETLLAEGDEDAVFISDFEQAATEVLQSDEDLSAAFSTYVEARRKLNEKFRSRGFWPLGKGKGRSQKGKMKGKSSWGSRKSLQQRILESNCRLCGKKGHWRNECPNKPQGGTSTSSAAVTVSLAEPAHEMDSSMPEEFLLLPEMSAHATKDILSKSQVNVQSVFYGTGVEEPTNPPRAVNMKVLRDKIRSHIAGRYDTNFGVKTLVSRIEQKLRLQASQPATPAARNKRILRTPPVSDSRSQVSNADSCPTETTQSMSTAAESPISTAAHPLSEAFFATHDTHGILDTGATKTVIGSVHVKEFLDGLQPEIKKHVMRCPCNIVFRFGNQGTLKASHAIVVPVCGMRLKIAVVQGATPFLISNTLLRALGALMDTQNHELVLPKQQAKISLQLSPKGLYLLDMNQLIAIAPVPENPSRVAETFTQDALEKCQKSSDGPDETTIERKPEDFSDMSAKAKKSESMLAKEHLTTCAMNPKGNSESSQFESSPVRNDYRPTPPIQSKFCDQDIRAQKRPVSFPYRHEHVVTAPCQSSGQCGFSGRGGTNRPPEPARAQENDHGLWKGPCGKDIPRSVAVRANLDQMVPGTLCQQLEGRAPSDDSIHSTDDRRSRERDASAICQKPSEGVGCTAEKPVEATGCTRAASGIRDGCIRDDVRSPMGSRSRDPRGHSCPPSPHVVLGDSDAANAHDDADCHAQPAADDSESARHWSGRMGRSLEQIAEYDDNSRWVLQAGEMDSFCPSNPNKESIHFWDLVNNMEKELKTLAKICNPSGPKLDVLEVFCHPDSMLSSQINQLWG